MVAGHQLAGGGIAQPRLQCRRVHEVREDQAQQAGTGRFVLHTGSSIGGVAYYYAAGALPTWPLPWPNPPG